MAPSTSTTSTQEQLLQSLLPKSITVGKSRKYREAFNRRVKHHNYARTNQFEIVERCEGLEEKFQILNRDDLSEALRSRCAELRIHASENRFLPDVLDLLLRLSVDPANIKQSDYSISDKEQPSDLPPLRWADVEGDDPINHDDPMWQSPHYSDLSSDGGLPTSSTGISPQSTKNLGGKAKGESPELAGKLFEERPFSILVDLSVYRGFNGGKEEASITLTELQATKECLFMLQGLPTRLYTSNGIICQADPRYSLRNVSHEVFQETLFSFALLGARVNFMREWLTKVPATQYTKALQQSIAGLVSGFDAGISELQAQLLRPSGNVHVGLLPSLANATQYFKDLQSTWEYLQMCDVKQEDSIRQLEVLFDLICAEQAAGRVDECSELLEIFMPMFQVYLKPLVHWMRYGEVHENLEDFFVTSGGQQQNYTNLWHGWYVLDKNRGRHRAPKFLQGFVEIVFVLGKTTLFLHRLDDQYSDIILEASSLLQCEDLVQALKSNYLSFAEVFAEIFASRIRSALIQTSARLYQQLDRRCGLWDVLETFDYIYFANDGPVIDNIEAVLFRRLDKCSTSWSDRFLLSDLFENAFASIPIIATDRLTMHSSNASARSIESQRMSVKVLGNLSVTYQLPWQIANIIPQSCSASYQRNSLLLMQIRRSRYSLERRAYFHVMKARRYVSPDEQKTSLALYQKLLLFGNILYNHLTSLVIGPYTTLMKRQLRQASTVDEMAQVHTTYLTKLERACLTSKRLAPIHDTVISILDLSIRFADIVIATADHRASVDGEARLSRNVPRQPHRTRQQRHEDDGDDSENEDEEASSGTEDYSTFIKLDESSLAGELKRMSGEFDKHLAFIAAGLKSLGRVDREESWEILSGRLDWKRGFVF